MKNEQESSRNLKEKGCIRTLNFKCCMFASMLKMVVMISDDETIMKGGHTNDEWPICLAFIFF
jgi:hypothetical protein